jgi:hypothetical protein
MKKMPARIASLILSGVMISLLILIVSPELTHAAATPTPTPACPPNQAITEVGCLPTDPIQFVSSFYGIGLSIIGGVALLFIIFGGYIILTSRGNPNQVNVGKSYIFYSLLGLILAIFGYLFLEVGLVDILHIPGFGH